MNLSAKVRKDMMWQTMASPCSWSPSVGPAGRRLATSFRGWLARSLAQRGISDRMRLADSSDAASLRDGVNLVVQASAAQGCVGGGERFEGPNERASPRRCLRLGDEVRSDAGASLAARSR